MFLNASSALRPTFSRRPLGVPAQVATKAQLEALVARALADGSILVFDAAYAPFIRTRGRRAVRVDRRGLVET